MKGLCTDPSTHRSLGSLLGPIQNQMQYEKVLDIFKDTKEKGYKFAVGSPEFEAGAKGFYVKPAIIDNPPNDSRIIQEEPFGPVSMLDTFHTHFR